MRIFHQRITIINIRKPSRDNVNQQLQWFGTSLGLFNLRDKDKSCFRIFIELLRAAKKREPLSSDELAYNLNLSRGTIIHHLNKLIESGLVVHDGNKYMLRVDNLKQLVTEVQKDIRRTCDDLIEMGEKIDKCIGLE